jgi:branched-chain amino acid transport system substrate-binding protein
MGPGIQFNEKGQNDKLKNGAIQNRAGKFAIIGPKAQSDSMPELPMTAYDKRG